jgi:tripartite-type tricarboxylate transporter receptor subunit TctC
MGAKLGKPVVVENRAGANGQIGASSVARAAPDGYTLLVASAETQSMTSSSKKLPYDPVKAFTPIGPFAINPFMIAARVDLPVSDAASLVAYANLHPGTLNYGSWGLGSTGHVAMEMFKAASKIDLQHVPFNGTAPAESALLGGHIDLLVMPVGRAVVVRLSKRIRVLNAMTSERTALMDDVPTLREAGYRDIVAANWFGLMAPAGTTDNVIEQLKAALDAALSQKELRAALNARGVEIKQSSSKEFSGFVVEEQTRWSSTSEKARIQLD